LNVRFAGNVGGIFAARLSARLPVRREAY